MHILSWFESEQKEALNEKIAEADWSAARFLVKLLREGRFLDTLGGWGDVYLLMDGEEMVSFATLTGQDSIPDPALTPWIGFVYTAPAYRGHRYAGKLLAHIEGVAAQKGFEKTYLGTDHEGLYEKYGYTYRENRVDCWGEDTRVMEKECRKEAD